jgi:hypothetical protein
MSNTASDIAEMISNSIPPHQHVSGDYTKFKKSIKKRGLDGLVQTWSQPTLETISIGDLTPLETQRQARTSWAQKMLKNLGGFDGYAFGVLSVARCPLTNTNYVFDGCGRMLIADAAGIESVPCLVYDLDKKSAAKYFAYNQKDGRRTLSPEAIFVNAYTAGDDDAQALGAVLDHCGLFVRGDTLYSVPHNPAKNNTCEIKYRAIAEGYKKIAGEDKDLCKQARDMIYRAFATKSEGDFHIQQDLYWAVLQLLVTYPETQKNGLNRNFQKYLDYLGDGNSQGQITRSWKDAKGLTGNVGISKTLAYNLLQSWRQSKISTRGVQNLALRNLNS